ncbi:MAG: type IV pilus modification protein PilV [Cardiobacteriaceae bacterium]|nr:type IV pilus modification protein PilV [Cardiobacteriaceae bacterium]
MNRNTSDILIGITHSAYQRGMTLLEVLISMLVVALGLGLSVSMIQTANRFGDSAEYRARALQKTEEIAGKIQANINARNTYVLDNGISILPTTSFDELYRKADFGSRNPSFTCLSTCTKAEEIAKDDVKSWLKEIQSDLFPNGRALIHRDGGVDSRRYEVIVMWSHIAEADIKENSDNKIEGTRVWISL